MILRIIGCALVPLATSVRTPASISSPPPPARTVAASRPLAHTPAQRGLADSARAAVARALPLLQSSAETWIARRSCTSCHHQGLGLLTVSLARERRFPIDTARLTAQVARIVAPGPNWLEKYVLGEISTNEAIGQPYRFLGAGSAGYEASTLTAAMVSMLAARQHVTGRWSSYSRRPPLEDSEFTATALTIRALSLFPVAARRGEFEGRIARATRWLERATPASTEDQVMQLLGLGWGGASARAVRASAAALLSAQQPDGGWAQVTTRLSDAYATGQALVALNQVARVPMRDPRLQRGLRFLLDSQQEDGSWHVRTRRTASPGLPYFESGYPHGKDQFISYAGAAWATMALILSDGDARSTVFMGHPRPRHEAPAPAAASAGTMAPGVTPLMERALFGTTDELRVLLQAGARVNDTTSLGLTALMFAVHDSAKVRLLLDAGANVDAMAATGHTALSLAAATDGARGSVALLLARGTTIDRPARVSNLAGSTALGRAVSRGDTLVAAMLLARGAAIDGVPGLEATPLVTAAFYGDAEMTRWLLEHGAHANGTAPEGGLTPLMAAAEDGNTGVVRALLAAGVNVNARDEEGRTALHLAAQTVDRGNTDIVEALLAAGADPSLRSAKGETPADLARRWGRDNAARRLAGAR